MITAPYLYLVQLDVPQHIEPELHRIYDEEHIPHLLEVPGCLGCTRFRVVGGDVEGAPRFTAIWEMARPDITGLYGPNGAAWAKAAARSDFVHRISPHVTKRSHLILERIAPPHD